MDKKEYNEKLEEIKGLIAAEDYSSAAQIADSIDWKRVRNVQTLVMISEVYEAVERYEDSKTLLLRAYRRSPVGRTVLYRLVEVTIKLNQFDEAIEYYSEYVQAAPRDNSRYILKYKIYRARGSSVDEQISILKEYLKQEYNEKWAYELAKLQISAGRTQDALSTCDDLVLWFHSGKYVIKALELKRRYAPLTPKQQEIYDGRFDDEDSAEYEQEGDDTSYLKQAEAFKRSERVDQQQEKIKSELARDISRVTRNREAMENDAALPDSQPETISAGAAVSGAAQEAGELAEAAITGAVQEAGETAETAIPGAVQEAGEMPETAIPGAVQEAGEMAETAFTEAVQEAGETAETAVTGAVQEAGEAAEAAISGAVQETEEAAEAAGSGAEQAAGTFSRAEADPYQEEALSEEMPDPYAGIRTDYDPQQMQEDLIQSMREIVSGVGARQEEDSEEARLDEMIEQSKEDQENAVAARGADMTFRVPVSRASAERAEASRLTIDDILLAMGEKGDHVRKITSQGSVLAADEEARMNAQASALTGSQYGMHPVNMEEAESSRIAAEEKLPEADTAAGSAAGAADTEEIAVNEAAAEESIINEAAADDAAVSGAAEDGMAGGEAPAAALQTAPEAAAEETVINEAAAEETVINEAASDEAGVSRAADAGTAGEAAEKDSRQGEAAAFAGMEALYGLPPAAKVTYTKEIAEAKTKQLPVEEIRKLHEAFLMDTPVNEARLQPTEPVAGSRAQSTLIQDSAQPADAAPSALSGNASGAEAAQQAELSKAEIPAEAELSAGRDEDMQTQVYPGENRAADAGSVTETEKKPAADAAGTGAGPDAQTAVSGQQEGPVPAVGTVEVKADPDVSGPQIYGARPILKEYQKDLFRGFLGVGSLEEQIANAIMQAESKNGDRTSRTGNILILGGHGCGKTTIATGIAKAVAEDMGTHSVKMARIYAADLNRKDIAATIAKIAGGILIIEEAGDLEDAVVDQLTTAMEFRTDGLIVILEDEQRYIHDMLMRHPRFTMKFTAQIYIPVFTNDNLVDFGVIYADSQDYVLDERAEQVLYDRIDAVAQNGGAVSITNVVELVDRAIRNANKFFRKLGSQKKRYDSLDRIILREKDFR